MGVSVVDRLMGIDTKMCRLICCLFSWAGVNNEGDGGECPRPAKV